MPEQAEWVGNTVPRHVSGDDDDYSYAWSVKPVVEPVQTQDTHPLTARMAALETTVTMLVDEVQHLRDDLARVVSGQSSL